MMARLSGSRIEASVEALAGTKQELKLRTIVQFVRVCNRYPPCSASIPNLSQGQRHVTRLENRHLSDYRQPSTLERSPQVYER